MESRGRLMVLSALQQVDWNGDEEPAAKRSKIKMQSLRDEEENRQGNFSIEELFKIMESRGRLMVLSALQQVDWIGDEEPAAKRSKIKMQSLRDEEENRQGSFSIEELEKGNGVEGNSNSSKGNTSKFTETTAFQEIEGNEDGEPLVKKNMLKLSLCNEKENIPELPIEDLNERDSVTENNDNVKHNEAEFTASQSQTVKTGVTDEKTYSEKVEYNLQPDCNYKELEVYTKLQNVESNYIKSLSSPGCSFRKSMNKTDKPNSMKITLKKIDNIENQKSSDDDSSSSEDVDDTDQDPDFGISSEDRHKYRYNKKNKNVWMTRLESESSESVHTTEECDRQSNCGQKKKRTLKNKRQTKYCSGESEEGNEKKETRKKNANPLLWKRTLKS
ncbi:hypothetical protein J6590_044558 [Homalodisca vitripennis]|nr:hypothetical protein J6590_044558 [Homalodisca vitripennis]